MVNLHRMINNIRKTIFCCLFLCCFFVLPAKEKRLAILFTNDIHSSGDYARMATLIKQQRDSLQQLGYPVILVDAGDIAMGSVFQTLYTESAFEYVTLGKMGYDAYTFGNHDFDFGLQALYEMMDSAVAAQLELPVLLCSNLSAPDSNGFTERTGVKDTLVLRKYMGADAASSADGKSVKIGLFGLMGEHAYSCIVCKDSLIYSDRIEVARRNVEALQNAGADYIIALSHGGTLWANGKRIDLGEDNWQELKSQSEDGILAHNFPQINAIISGHDHEALSMPLVYGKTVIGSTGNSNANLGRMLLNGDSLADYSLIPISKAIMPDYEISRWIAGNYRLVEEKFHKLCNLGLDDTIAYLNHPLPLCIQPDGNMPLGQIIAESYINAVKESGENLSGKILDENEIVAVVPYGVIRRGLDKGHITNHNVFDVLPLGMAPNGAPGYPLVMAWLTGRELEDICELNASVAGGMEDARLFFAGMSFEYNRFKIPFTRVTKVLVNGKPVEKERLYPVVTGLYTAQLMGMLESSSFGLLKVQPKDANGNPVLDLASIVLKRCDSLVQNPEIKGRERYITEWLAFAEYAKKTELKNQYSEPCSVDASTPLIYFKYLAVAILIVLLLLYGKRLLYRQS